MTTHMPSPMPAAAVMTATAVTVRFAAPAHAGLAGTPRTDTGTVIGEGHRAKTKYQQQRKNDAYLIPHYGISSIATGFRRGVLVRAIDLPVGVAPLPVHSPRREG